MFSLLAKEPALISSIVAALVSFDVAFGLKLDQQQTEAIMGLATVAAGIITRANVVPIAAVISGAVAVVTPQNTGVVAPNQHGSQPPPSPPLIQGTL
jgi:hypothetical protein